MAADILEQILAVKRDEVAALRKRASRQSLLDQAAAQSPPRGFAAALRAKLAAGGAGVIAEIKKASPSKGVIRADFDPVWLAKDYAQGGAACLSVLTDERFFQGAARYMSAARAATDLPTLRKDFMVDALQIAESRAIGADAVLLIAAALSAAQMRELADAADALGMDVLVEIHDGAELDTVLAAELLPRALLGINNRSLRSFETRLETTLDLLPHLPAGCEVVTESGINGAADIARMRRTGVQRFLIGEHLMRAPSPGAALKDWLNAA